MEIYSYDPKTGEYLGSSEADPNPLEDGEWLIPALATVAVPESAPSGFVSVFKDGGWQIVEDHRGERFFSESGGEVILSDLGPVPDGLLTEKPPRKLVGVAEEALIQIDVLAENERKRYITPGEGQALTYQEKTEEAKAFQAAPIPVDTDYPHLYEEAQATYSTVADVAALVLFTKQAWTQVSAKIEATRRGAKVAVTNASSVEEVDSIIACLNWPVLGDE